MIFVRQNLWIERKARNMKIFMPDRGSFDKSQLIKRVIQSVDETSNVDKTISRRTFLIISLIFSKSFISDFDFLHGKEEHIIFQGWILKSGDFGRLS